MPIWAINLILKSIQLELYTELIASNFIHKWKTSFSKICQVGSILNVKNKSQVAITFMKITVSVHMPLTIQCSDKVRYLIKSS